MAKFEIKNGNPQIEEWILDYVGEMVENVIETNKKMGVKFTKNAPEDIVRERLFNDYYSKINKALEGVELDENNVNALEAMKPEDGFGWVKGESDPFTLQKEKDIDKFKDILEMDDDYVPKWSKMTTDELAPFALEMGYKFYDPKDRKLFLKRISDATETIKKGRIQNELDNSVEGVVGKLVFPGAYNEASKQILTGHGKDSDIYKAAAIDAGADVAMALTPSVRFAKNPFANGAVGAGIQGAEETGRNLAQKKGLGESISSGFKSAALAGSIPGLVGGISGMVGQIPMMRNFSRGMTTSVKSADPTFLEREKVVNAVKTANKFDKNAATMSSKNVDMAAEADFGDAVKKFFDESDPKKVGEMYDDLALGKSDTAFNQSAKLGDEKAKEVFENAEKLFSAARSETGVKSGMQQAGKKFGIGVNYLGTRIEPIIQGNPLKSDVRSYDYKEQDWYKKLPAESRKMIDDAYKAKENEQ